MRWRITEVPVALPEPLFAFVQKVRRSRHAARRVRRAQSAGVLLRARTYRQAAQVGDEVRSALSELDGGHQEDLHELDPRCTALVLVDVWAAHPVAGWQERAEPNIRDAIVPLLECCRNAGVRVVHALHGQAAHPRIQPRPEELLVNDSVDQERAVAALRRDGVEHLLYAGYASNVCILNRPIGVVGGARLGFDVIFVRDASLAVETPESLEGQWAHRMACTTIELNWGCSTTVADVRAAFS